MQELEILQVLKHLLVLLDMQAGGFKVVADQSSEQYHREASREYRGSETSDKSIQLIVYLL